MNRSDHTDVGAVLRAAAVEVRDAVAAAPLPPARSARRPRPLLAAVAVAAAVTAVVVGLTTFLGGDVRTGPPAAPTTSPPSPAVTTAVRPSPTAAPEPVCGEALPVRIYPPKGWKGPLPGPADGSTTDPAAGLLVVHWTGPDGAVEVRWPSSVSDAQAYDPNESMSAGATDGGRVTLALPVPGEVPCTHLAAEWFGEVPKGFGASLGDGLSPEARALFTIVTAPEDLRLVTSTRRVAAAPTAPVPCDGGNVPARGGKATTAPQPSPEQALRAFLDGGSDAVDGMNRRGWTRFDLANGGVAFGVPFEGGPGWVQLVHLAQTPDGWVVDRWTTSGC